MQPTQEQQEIIHAVQSGQHLRVSAFAGTGKTTTLELIGRAYPQRKGLYLAYNRAVLDDSKGKFPSNVVCKTTHSLAYASYGCMYKNKLNNRITSIKIAQHLQLNALRQRFEGHNLYASERNIAACANRIVSIFCNSVDESIGPQHLSMYHIRMLTNRYKKDKIKLDFDRNRIEQPKLFLEHYARLCLRVAARLWACMIDLENQYIGITHDGYLKLYQLSKPVIHGFDYIMLDESQDANPAILDIFENQQIQRIYVGDQHQQIYSWRGSINAMEKVPGEQYYLTQSFRFGQPIADFANKILKQLGENHSIIANPAIESQLSPIDDNQPFTVLCRTNAGVLDSCIRHIEYGKKVACVGGIKDALTEFRSAYHLWKKDTERVTSMKIKMYYTWENLIEETQLTNDPDLRGVVRFVMEHQESCLDIIQKIESALTDDESQAQVIISTAHKAKGRQWPQVCLQGDFEDYNECAGEELNLWYVAATRAIHVLDLSEIDFNAEIEKEEEEAKPSQPPLTIELVPETAWFSNVRSILTDSEWRAISKRKAREAGQRCEICAGRGPKWPVECHEIWHYDDERKKQTLKDLIALCPACHQVKHMGLANIRGKADEAKAHLCKVNQWDQETASRYIDAQFALWQERSQYNWTLNIEVLKDKYGIIVEQHERQQENPQQSLLLELEPTAAESPSSKESSTAETQKNEEDSSKWGILVKKTKSLFGVKSG